LECVTGRAGGDAVRGSTEESKKLMCDGGWRDGTFAEFVRVPLENCIVLDENRLCQSLGYTVHDLVYMAYLLVPFGGIRDINLQAGETIIICPATGFYGSLGVQVAVAMGARVLAMGRSEEKLGRLVEDVKRRSLSPGVDIETVIITGDEDKDADALRAFGAADAVLDLTPAAAATSTHTKSTIKALRCGGRASLMGSTTNFAVPQIMVNNITLKGTVTCSPLGNLAFGTNGKYYPPGKMMYERKTIVHFAKILERGPLPLGKDLMDTKVFSLEDWKVAFDTAAEHNGEGVTYIFRQPILAINALIPTCWEL
jgi:D-arabinose 1-dehydrogenase-like Zn-dependent alcohol dehydrogenase